MKKVIVCASLILSSLFASLTWAMCLTVENASSKPISVYTTSEQHFTPTVNPHSSLNLGADYFEPSCNTIASCYVYIVSNEGEKTSTTAVAKSRIIYNNSHNVEVKWGEANPNCK